MGNQDTTGRSDPLSGSLANSIEHGPEAQLPVPDTTEPMVIKSLRIPLRLAEDLEREAGSRGIGVTVLMRQLLEQALNGPAHTDYVPLEEAISMLSRLARPIPPGGLNRQARPHRHHRT